jgi:predicted site-specific integrase-resolvase
MTKEYRPFLDQAMLAERWLISQRTLEGWRIKGIGPFPTKIGSRVRYRLEDVEKFETAHLSKGAPNGL